MTSSDIDYGRSTNAYPAPAEPVIITRGDDEDVDYAASTMAYPVAEGDGPVVVDQAVDADGNAIDLSASTNAYPMTGVVVETKDVRFMTEDEAADFTAQAEAAAAAAAPVEGDAQAKVVEAPAKRVAKTTTKADSK